MSGRAARIRSIDAQIVRARVAAVHGSEDAVRARLHRQMQMRHQRRQVAMRRDQIVVHVARMAGRVAQPLDARGFRRRAAAAGRASTARRPALAVIGVDVLAEQRHLAHAGSRPAARPPRRSSSTGRETSAPRV